MSPEESYLEKQAKAEEEKLQKKIEVLSDSDRKQIYEKGNIWTARRLITRGCNLLNWILLTWSIVY